MTTTSPSVMAPPPTIDIENICRVGVPSNLNLIIGTRAKAPCSPAFVRRDVDNMTEHNEKNITDFDIQALVDHELDANDERQLLYLLNNDETLRKRYDELIRQKNALKMWYKSAKDMKC